MEPSQEDRDFAQRVEMIRKANRLQDLLLGMVRLRDMYNTMYAKLQDGRMSAYLSVVDECKYRKGCKCEQASNCTPMDCPLFTAYKPIRIHE